MSVPLGRGRTLALVALLAALAAYGAVAESLPGLPSRVDLALVALLVVPASLAAIWLALPLARVEPAYALLIGALGAGLVAITLEVLGVGSVANVSKLVCYTLVGFWFLSLFEELWWIALVAVLVPWVDVWSVIFGPTRYVVEEQPGLFDRVSIAFGIPGEPGSVALGPPDVIFFALFLATALRFSLRVGWTWLGMTAALAVTLVLVWEWDVLGLPALPAVCAGFVVANADLLWKHAAEAWHGRHTPETP